MRRCKTRTLGDIIRALLPVLLLMMSTEKRMVLNLYPKTAQFLRDVLHAVRRSQATGDPLPVLNFEDAARLERVINELNFAPPADKPKSIRHAVTLLWVSAWLTLILTTLQIAGLMYTNNVVA